MEKPASEIPIYKICHLRSQNEEMEMETDIAALTPEYNVLYVFYGNVEFTTDDGQIVNINDVFLRERANPFFRTIFSDYELQSIQQNHIKVVFLPERIYPDDSIETIKKKFLYLTRDKVGLSYAELYFFCKQVKHITTQLAHDQITSNGNLEITPVRIQNYLLNIDNHPRQAGDVTTTGAGPEYAKLGIPAGGTSGNYTYSNIANLKLEENPRIVNIVLGQELNYPYAVNPLDAMNADPFLEIHAGEIVNTTNKTVLIDYGVFLHNTIYMVSAEDALVYAKTAAGTAGALISTSTTSLTPTHTKPVNEGYIVQVYYPYLSNYRDDTRRTDVEIGSAEASGEIDLSTIHSHNTLLLHKLKLFDADKKILNERFLRQTANIKLLYDIYERRTTDQNYMDNGIRGVEFMIHPETPYNQSLDAVFKIIHCSEYIPYIKYNPGKKQDNIYKFFISGVSRSGRKIPYLPKGDIFRLIKTTARKKSVAIFIQYTYSNPAVPDHKATHLPVPVLCEFYPDGTVYVKLFVKYSFTTNEMEEIIKATVNPVLRVIKEHVEQSGFHMNLFTKLYHSQIEIINIEYFAQLAITRNIEIKQMIRCISSAFNEIEGSLKKGIVLRYKRVSNYNDMSSQDAYMIEMMNKRQSDRDIIEGLKDNYMMSESDARAKLSALLNSLQTQQMSRFRGGSIRIKNNPGFLTKITKGAFNSIITIEISNINNILFLPALHIYLDSILRVYQDPTTTEIPYEKISQLCASGTSATAPATALPPASASVAATAAASIVTAPAPAAVAVIGNVDSSEKEEPIEMMTEIVPVLKKPASATGPASASGGVTFGFEAEPEKEEAVDLFDLLQDDDDDNGGDDDDASNQGGGGGGGGAGAAAAKKKPTSGEEEEDLSDITGMELANPNPFSKRIQERDPIIHLNEGIGKFNAYSRSCPWSVHRQPVILTQEEKARIDREHPNSYSHSITYGSDPSKQYHYICPRYWSLKHNTSLTEEEVKSGKYGAVIPQKAKKIPPGANIFEFTDDKYHKDEKGNYKQHYPGFLKKDAHPKGLCVPCCFGQWDKPSQLARRQECESKQFEDIRTETAAPGMEEPATGVAAAAAATTGAEAAPPPTTTGPVKINEMKDDRILSSDKFPLDNKRWGYLPIQVQKFLFSDSRNCQVSLKNTALKKDTPCLLRRGVETNDHQSFVSVMAYYYKESIALKKTFATTSTSGLIAKSAKNEIRDMIASATSGAGATAGMSIKEMITKSITDSIQKQTAQLQQQARGGDTSRPAPEPESALALERNEESEDETPVAMTPKPILPAKPAPATNVPTIREMRNLIIQSLDIGRFITLQNGTLSDVFYNPNKELRETDLIEKYGNSEVYRQYPRETSLKICNAFENFIAYLDDDASIIDHTYLWDIMSQPNDRLFKNGNNIILIHIPDDDITNNVQVICPTNAYSGEVFDANRTTVIIMKRDKYYEPIYLFESKSNGRFNVMGRFAIKSKTIAPKIKYVIETIRDLYFSYCRLHASQPREYKYKMNLPAKQIAKMVTDAGFTIHAQVHNFNGRIIGLQISQTMSIIKLNPTGKVKKTRSEREWKGVIPTAVSASEYPNTYPVILMDDDSLWSMSYRETVEFLDTVAQQVKKKTKKDIYCRAKVKVVEDGLVVGVLTETNQFIQVNVEKDPQLNQDDGLPTITEGNHFIVDKEVALDPDAVDKTREKYVRNIRLETNFYNVFRNTARNILNRPENKAVKDDIEKLIASPFTIYQNKLSQIIAHMKRIMGKYVSFIRYNRDTLKMVGEISGCIANDDETCGKKSYCLKEAGNMCKLLLPQRNLMYPDIDNEIAYFGKLSDEMIRYERVKLFMYGPTKYMSFQDRKYNLHDDEIILLETFITQEYFENMEPADANPYVFQTNFYTVAPSNAGSRGIQAYDPVYRKEYVDRYLELESLETREPREPVAPMLSGVETFQVNEINHVLDYCREVTKREVTEKMRKLVFPTTSNVYEIMFSNESEECSFDVMLTILRSVAQTASKCPSGHHCVRQKSMLLASTSTSASDTVPEPEICNKCRASIGKEETELACRQCNYFICDNCQYQHMNQLGDMTVIKLKSILLSEYDKLARMGLEKKLTMILNGYGMKKYADVVSDGRATLSQIIQSQNYFLTNVDIWILAIYFKLPIVFVSQSLLIENGRNMMVLYGGDEMVESYYFIHPFSVEQNVISRYGLIEKKLDDETSVLKIPLEFVSSDVREKIRSHSEDQPTASGSGTTALEEYIRGFKLGDIKHKKQRVFTLMEPSSGGIEPANGGGGN